MAAEFWDREGIWGSPELICVVEKTKIFLPVLLVVFSVLALNPALCCPRTVSYGVDVWVSTLAGLKPLWSFLFRFLLFLQSRLFLHCVLTVLFLYHPKKALSFSFKVMMFLHYLWVGPLQAVAVTALLWMEIGMSCLAGMVVLIFLLLLQSSFGMLFSSLR